MAFETVQTSHAIVYTNDESTAEPDVAAAIPAAWDILGAQQYPEGGGVEMNFAEAITPIRLSHLTLPVKNTRPTESPTVGLTLRNASLEAQQIVSESTITQTGAIMLGPAPNTFNGANRLVAEAARDAAFANTPSGTNTFAGADQAAAEAQRDAYFTANPAQLTQYDNDATLYITLNFGGTTIYQNRVGGAWVDYTPPIVQYENDPDLRIALTFPVVPTTTVYQNRVGGAWADATPPTPAISSLELLRGISVGLKAVVLRLASPYVATGTRQYYAPRCYLGRNGAFAHNRVTPTDIPIQIVIQQADPNAIAPTARESIRVRATR